MANQIHRDEESYFHSLNCVDVFFDEPGDTNVRPCRPSLLEFARKLRAKVEAAQAEQSQAPHTNGDRS